MLVSIEWLSEYVEIEQSGKQIADHLTMSGSHADSIEKYENKCTGIVVGKILSIDKHPDADKLVVTQVDIGKEEPLQIVTGAKNISVGDYIPLATVGAVLPGNFKIKKGKLRGQVSEGMMCSLEEMGFGDSVIPKEAKDGIYLLPGEFELGMDIRDALKLRDDVIDFEITNNRPDCLSMIGMARETAATFSTSIKLPEAETKKCDGEMASYLKDITIEATDLCKRYMGRVVKDVKIEPSPAWMQVRLMKAGVRPINNVVDVTNYVMLETGQPLHAFDVEKVGGKEIRVRRAKKGETLMTLDGVERELSEDSLVIADASKPIALAGIMGGGNSEISETTTTILIESANFDGKTVRLGAKALGMRTEASNRFEKDLDVEMVSYACHRACALLEQLGAGVVVGGEMDAYPTPYEAGKLSMRLDRAAALLGVSIPVAQQMDALKLLGFNPELKGDEIEIQVPSHRGDIEIEADIIEEVGRIYGFHNIEPAPLQMDITQGRYSEARVREDRTKEILRGLGFNEIMTYSFISEKIYDKLCIPQNDEKRKVIRLMNPLGEDFSIMRTTLLGNMLQVVSRNMNRGVKEIAAFELGNLFIPKALPVTELPEEKMSVCMARVGGETDFYEMKGAVEALLDGVNVQLVDYVAKKEDPTFHPGRTAKVMVGETEVGTVGQIHPMVAENFDIDEPIYAAELDMKVIHELAADKKTYQPLPKYPAITRDLALLVPADLPSKMIEKAMLETGGKLVESAKLFDVYMGAPVPEGWKSLAYSVAYRAADRTLKDEEVGKVQDKILERLEKDFEAKLR